MSVANGLSPERLERQLREIAELNERLDEGPAPFRVLSGMEVDINEDGSLDAPDELLARLDVVVASPHIKLRMDRAAMTRRLVLAVANPHVDVLGHVTGRKVGWAGARVRPAADLDPDIVFAACARFDVAVEVNCRPERQDPPRSSSPRRWSGAADWRSTPMPTPAASSNGRATDATRSPRWVSAPSG